MQLDVELGRDSAKVSSCGRRRRRPVVEVGRNAAAARRQCSSLSPLSKAGSELKDGQGGVRRARSGTASSMSRSISRCRRPRRQTGYHWHSPILMRARRWWKEGEKRMRSKVRVVRLYTLYLFDSGIWLCWENNAERTGRAEGEFTCMSIGACAEGKELIKAYSLSVSSVDSCISLLSLG